MPEDITPTESSESSISDSTESTATDASSSSDTSSESSETASTDTAPEIPEPLPFDPVSSAPAPTGAPKANPSHLELRAGLIEEKKRIEALLVKDGALVVEEVIATALAKFFHL